MDDRSNNAAFEPTEPLNDDATTPTTQVSVDSLRPATPPIGAAVTSCRNPIRVHGLQTMRLVTK